MKQSFFDKILDSLLSHWYGYALLALCCLGLAYGSYSEFTALETGSREMVIGNKLVIGLYKIGGKWPVVLAFVALAGWLSYVAYDTAQMKEEKAE